MEAAIKVGPRITALDPKAMEQLQLEVSEKKNEGSGKGGIME